MEQFREQIDILDESIQNLFLERMQTVEKVALYKKENNLPVYDEERERTIIKKNVDRIDNPDLASLYEEFYKKMLEVSKKYQERILDK